MLVFNQTWKAWLIADEFKRFLFVVNLKYSTQLFLALCTKMQAVPTHWGCICGSPQTNPFWRTSKNWTLVFGVPTLAILEISEDAILHSWGMRAASGLKSGFQKSLACKRKRHWQIIGKGAGYTLYFRPLARNFLVLQATRCGFLSVWMIPHNDWGCG